MVNVTIKEAMNWAKNEADNRQPFLTDDIAFLIGERLDLNPSQLKLKQDQVLTAEQLTQLESDYHDLKSGQSPQYILGFSWFFGYKLKVNENVLIPRFDTEDLVAFVRDDLVELNKTNPTEIVKVIDVGTGSGAITVALNKQLAEKGIEIDSSASDISPNALNVAQENFLDYQLNIETYEADILNGLGMYDVIISNPPYIKTTETDLMDDSVINNEPDLALFAGIDGLDFYREFANQVDQHLNPGGAFYLEFGMYQQPDLAKLFGQKLPLYELEFRNDLAGHPRMVRGRKKK